jgi:hypothetical protein
VGQEQLDGSAGEHHQGERSLGGVEPVGASDDQSYVVVESFGAAVVHPEADGGEDAVAELADGLGDLDERGEPGAAGLRAPAVDQLGGLLGVEVPGEDRPEGLLEAVGPPQVPAATAQLAQCGALFVGEVLGSFEQCSAGAFELLGRGLVGQCA